MSNIDVATLGMRVQYKDVDAAARALGNMTTASDKAEQSTKRLEGTSASYERLVRRQIQATRELTAAISSVQAERFAQAQQRVATTTQNAGAAFQKMGEPLRTVTAQLAHVNPALLQMSNVLGTMAAGAGPMVAVLAGIAALGFAYTKLTEDTKKAKAASDELIQGLRDLAKERALGARGITGAQVDEGRKQLEQITQQIATLGGQRLGLGGDGLGLARVTADARMAALVTQYQKMAQLVTGGEEKVTEILKTKAEQRAAEEKRLLDEQKQRNALALAERIKFYEEMAIASQMDRIIARGIPGVADPIGSYGTNVAGRVNGPTAATVSLGSPKADTTTQLLGLIGGFAGFGSALKGMVDAINAQRLAAEELRRAAISLNNSIEGFANDTSLGGRIRGIQGQAASLRQATMDTYRDAIRRGDANADIAVQEAGRRLNEIEKERIRLLQEEDAALRKMYAQDLGVRNLRASGLDQQADDLAFQLMQERELAEARKQFNVGGKDSAEVMSLLATQAAEAAKRVRDLATALERTASEDLLGRMFRVTGGSAMNIGAAPSWAGSVNAGWFDMASKYVDELARTREASEREALLQQVNNQLAQDSLTVLKDQARTQEQLVSTTRSQFEALRTFTNSLTLGPMSPLSPLERLNESRRQYDAVLGLARVGDASALSSFGGTANTYLEALRGYYSSGLGFQTGYKGVLGDSTSLTAQFGAQLSIEEKTLAELQKQTGIAERTLNATQVNTRLSAANALIDQLNREGSIFNAPDLELFTRAFGSTGSSGIQLGFTPGNQAFILNPGNLSPGGNGIGYGGDADGPGEVVKAVEQLGRQFTAEMVAIRRELTMAADVFSSRR